MEEIIKLIENDKRNHLSADVKHRGKQKGKCFARASSGDADHIEPREADREADRLDGCWLGELAPLDALQNVGREVALFKLEDRARALNYLLLTV